VSAGKGKGAGLSKDREAARMRAKSPTAQERKQELPAMKKVKPKVRPARVERVLRYLLEHFEDHTSADKDEKAVWNENYSRFQDHAPSITKERFEGLLQDRDWEHVGRPVDVALGWVLYGIDFVRHVEERMRPDERKAEERARVLELKRAVQILEGLISFPDPRAAYQVLLWCAMARVYHLLPGCCHLAFSGPPSSGKTTAMKVALAIVNGLLVSDATEAYIARVLDDGRILGLDEVDEQLRAHKEGMLESILRQATDPKARRRILVSLGEHDWAPRDLDIYRPFVFTYMGSIEGALLTRTLVVLMTPNADAARVVRNFYPDEDAATLRIWLYDLAEKAREEWTTERVQEQMSSTGFLELLDTLKAGLPRDKEVAAVLLAVAEMFGWRGEVKDVVLTSLRAAAEDRVSEDESLVIREIAAGPWHAPSLPGGQDWMWQDELLTRINDRLRAQGRREWSPEWLGNRLTRLGLQDKKDRIKVSSEGGRRRILKTENVLKLLSLPSTSSLSAGTTGTAGMSRQASLDEAAVPAIPAVPAGSILERSEGVLPVTPLYERALNRFREDGQRDEPWVEQDLILAHQISEKDRPAVREIVHRARLVSLREKTHLPAASSEEISVDQAEGPAGKDERVKRGIRSLAVLAHLRSPEEPLEEIAARIADELRRHGHVVDLEQVKAEAKDVIELAFGPRSQEGKSSSPSGLTSSDESREKGKDEGGPPP